MTYAVKVNGMDISAEQVKQKLDIDNGEAQFMLLPSGLLRLRVNNKGKYLFFELGDEYEAYQK